MKTEASVSFTANAASTEHGVANNNVEKIV
ncbi:hypothetical protein KN1_02950 [Stygiolobus caldivivus]|uniref:Uncharacterized protein n=1 Tax=Stygiolobus caldivivus TaxID=2824673 RepID=A0A8D5ZDA2_9CREN|nr:hypothetical protein KN1_02950 [Stygiolobus caldivivus]